MSSAETKGSNLSVRSARIEYSARFTRAITDFQGVCELVKMSKVEDATQRLSQIPADCIRRIVRHMAGSQSQANQLLSIAKALRPPENNQQFRVAVRKRPLWPSEAAAGEFDAVTIDETDGRCCVHDGKAARDMSTYTLHREYALDHCFGADTDEDAMHKTAVDPLLNLALSGGKSSLILFGQTGTGKTHTAHRMQRHIAHELFARSSSTSGSNTPTTVEIEVFELRTKKAFDLLDSRKVVRLVTDSDEQVHVLGGKREIATNEEELLAIIDKAHALRSVSATERNAQSSRSHAVCRLRLGSVGGAGGSTGGMLTLVDLAGSERNSEVTKHDRVATLESADINNSLQTLKECFRATYNKDVDLETFVEIDHNDVEWTRAVPKGFKAAQAFRAAQEAGQAAQGLTMAPAKKGGADDGNGTHDASAAGDASSVPSTEAAATLMYDPKLPAALKNFATGGKKLHMPYRRHQLTLLLKDCFLNEDHRTVVVACCSPTATDVEHTWRTLSQVCQMRGAESDVCRETKVECTRTDSEAIGLLPFRKWDSQRVREWLSSLEDESLALAAAALPESTDGKELMRWPVGRLAHSCCGGEYEKAKALYAAIRAEANRMDGVAAERRGRVRGLAGRVDTYALAKKEKEAKAAAEAEAKAAAEAEAETEEEAAAEAKAEAAAEAGPMAKVADAVVIDDAVVENVAPN